MTIRKISNVFLKFCTETYFLAKSVIYGLILFVCLSPRNSEVQADLFEELLKLKRFTKILFLNLKFKNCMFL